jgi:bacterioferritin-associated ferredoxin
LLLKVVIIIVVLTMFVCVCKAVTDVEVRTAIERGACTREAVTRACGAGGDCGACHAHIEGMIEEHEELVAASSLVRERAA